MNGRGATEVRTIRRPVVSVGPTVGFDVDDQYGFDVDETVTLTVGYVPELTDGPGTRRALRPQRW